MLAARGNIVEDSGVSAPIRAFLSANINSVVRLEVLLLVHGAEGRAWTAADVAAALRVDPRWVQADLDELCRRELLECDRSGSPPTFRYRPTSDTDRRHIDALAAAYHSHRVAITRMIFQPKAVDPLRSFADAFRVRKEPPREGHDE